MLLFVCYFVFLPFTGLLQGIVSCYVLSLRVGQVSVLFYSEHGGNRFLRNVANNLLDYAASPLRKSNSATITWNLIGFLSVYHPWLCFLFPRLNVRYFRSSSCEITRPSCTYQIIHTQKYTVYISTHIYMYYIFFYNQNNSLKWK
jgi:hypothetical protein